MSRLLIVCAAVFVLGTLKCGQCAPSTDEIISLPGLAKQPPFKQYSGFLNPTATKKHHYWFVESYDSPANDPIVLWLNGGPGCSSLLGLLRENGPFTIQDDVTLTYNPYSWNMNANVLYMESPVGVGYSYSKDKNYTTNDDEVTLDNLSAMKDFFAKFPEYTKNALYLTGESYGGYYIPLLAAKMLDQSWNLQGIAVGNGFSDVSMNTNAMFYFAYYHGLFGAGLWANLIATCCAGKETRCNFSANAQPACVALKQDAFEMMFNTGLDMYNIYSECYPSEGGLGMSFDHRTDRYTLRDYGRFLWDLPGMAPQKRLFAKALRGIPVGKLNAAIGCENDTALTTYLNDAKVREALHIVDGLPPWSVCSAEVGSEYQMLYNTMKPQYLEILAAKKRILVYNGDVDMVCCFLADEWFVNGLNQELIENRKPWYYKEADGTTQVAGFAQQFENLVFTTIRGSGHLVPMDKPIQAFEMIQRFLRNQPF